MCPETKALLAVPFPTAVIFNLKNCMFFGKTGIIKMCLISVGGHLCMSIRSSRNVLNEVLRRIEGGQETKKKKLDEFVG